MKSPKWWYGFSNVDCELFESGFSNMIAPSKQLYCKRGKDKKYGDWLKCSFHQCPKFKTLRKKIREGDPKSIQALELNSFFDKKKIHGLIEK